MQHQLSSAHRRRLEAGPQTDCCEAATLSSSADAPGTRCLHSLGRGHKLSSACKARVGDPDADSDIQTDRHDGSVLVPG